MALSIGYDVGTYFLVTCHGKTEANTTAYNNQVNAYLELKDLAASTRKVLESLKKPMIQSEDKKSVLILGLDAIELAGDFGAKYQRPMQKGCVSSDPRSFEILAAMLTGMLNRITINEPTTLYYSKPANAISADTNVDLHGALLQGIFESYSAPASGKISVHAMNEAAAIIYSDCPDKTGIAISTGAGMVNICYVKFGIPVFSFSIAQSGDFIDQSVAKATGEPEAVVNQKKLKCNIAKAPTSQFELILKAQYELLIRSSIEKIIEGVTANMGAAAINRPVPIVIAGGVSSIDGFMDVFNRIFALYKFPIQVSEVRRAKEGIMAVAHGLYEAARNHA